MTVSDGDVLKSVIDHVLDDGTVSNLIFHHLASFEGDVSNSGVLDELETFIEDFYTEVLSDIDANSALGALEVNKVEFNETSGQWETTENVGTRYPSVTFTGSGEPLPNQIAGVLVAKTSRPKSYGKKFIAGFDELASTGPTWATSTLTHLAAALVYYLTNLEVATGRELIAGVVRSAYDTFLPFGTGTVDSVPGSQRRRKPGVGA